MKKIKQILIIILFLIVLMPYNIYAYSNHVILGGENIGIKVNTKYVTIVGFYKVNGSYIANDIGLEIGDYIIKVNGININNIDEMIDIMNKSEVSNINLTIKRNNKEYEYSLNLIKDNNGIYKSGIYVKDTINGIGSLTYIDPESLTFGALGHDITSKYTNKSVEINNGIIFKSDVIGINKGSKGKAGSKEAKLYTDNISGNININTNKGIFGKYVGNINEDKLIEIANPDEIKLGKAVIRTVISGSKEEIYNIEILSIDKNSETKNILFKVTDKDLNKKTGGIIAGMSGSPIIQNNKLIGAVTHVVLNNPEKGFGIFITTMLNEGDKE